MAVARRVLLATLVLNVADIVLHIAIDQAEALRITGNIVLIGINAAILVRPTWGRSGTCLVAGGLYLACNLIFIVEHGIGALGMILIVSSTLLMIGAAALLKRVR